LISALASNFRAAYHEVTPAPTIRKVQAQFGLVQSIISMAPIYSVVRKSFFKLMLYSVHKPYCRILQGLACVRRGDRAGRCAMLSLFEGMKCLAGRPGFDSSQIGIFLK